MISNARLLIVEDEEIVAFDIETTLQTLGYEVVGIVTTGEEAIATATQTKPDLVLMDIQLPGKLDGVEAAKEISQRLNIPVVYLTAHADQPTLKRAKITAPFGYLLKPFQEDELKTTIEIALSRHQSEERLRLALAKEKELNQLKTQFIAITSHEFRTPLTTISSSNDLLERYCRDSMDAKKEKHLRQIKLSVNQMIQLLDDVLLIGRAESGKVDLQLISINLVEFCHNLVEEIQTNAGEQYQIIFNHQGEVSEACLDVNLLRPILSNLLANAVKYSPEGGVVTFNLFSSDTRVTFQIQDSGIGIPPEAQKHLFESFHRASNVGTIKGTGLGLSIVKRCVDIHGGEISVDSEVNVGTTFTVTLPLT
ncbi:hybrid sensor histidine kinase/response regulator [Coleofasciculus sp. E2-BRE-01]|uniref:hybrid sensor histidine kinase/response regulator n=1 Tax=Coleofasciculus sp. E2-BRE-01 TaxID=3069524 RepID=UPI00330052BD